MRLLIRVRQPQIPRVAAAASGRHRVRLIVLVLVTQARAQVLLLAILPNGREQVRCSVLLAR
jgi:hypothetical protein